MPEGLGIQVVLYRPGEWLVSIGGGGFYVTGFTRQQDAHTWAMEFIFRMMKLNMEREAREKFLGLNLEENSADQHTERKTD